MADVILARDQLLDRPVAVKVLFPQYAADPTFVERFRREAQAAANLNHPSVVSVYDWGKHEDTYFIVMEYVEGRSLADVLASEKRLHPDRAAEVANDVASALGFAHTNGTVHRDVKPGNIMITATGQVKVTDFGIARAFGGEDEELTQTGSVMGTASYFSPEQAQGKTVDPRSDLYSLGIVLFEMVTGEPPFTGASPVSIAYKHIQEMAPRPSSINPAVSPLLDSIIARLLAKNPDDRYSAAEEVRSDLRRVLQGESGQPVAPAMMAGATEDATTAMAAQPGAYPPGVNGAMSNGYAEQTQMAGAPPLGAADHMGGAMPPGGMPPQQPGMGIDTGRRAVIDTTRAVPASAAVRQVEPVEEYYEQPSRTGVFLVLLGVILLALVGLIFYVFSLIGNGDEIDATEGETATVPIVIGQEEKVAIEALETAGFVVKPEFEKSETTTPGHVIRQDPEGNTDLEQGETVTIWISQTDETVEVPDVLGKTREEATQILRDLGLQVKIDREENDVYAEDEVFDQSYDPGNVVNLGSEITIWISLGPSDAIIPSVANLDQNQARQALTDAGFEAVTFVQEPSATVPQGFVIGTDPPVGTTSPLDRTIVIKVSLGAAPAPVPSLTGLNQEAAEVQLRNLQFIPVVEFVDSTPENAGKVVDQTPAPGSQQPIGTEVVIRVGRNTGVTTTVETTTTTVETTTTTADTTTTTADTTTSSVATE